MLIINDNHWGECVTAINKAAKKLLNKPLKEDLDKFLTRCKFPLIGEPKSRTRAAPFPPVETSVSVFLTRFRD